MTIANMKNTSINEEDEMLMNEYGITRTTKNIYHYKDYSYEKLSDAHNYAKIDSTRAKISSQEQTTHAQKKAS